jgi:hypothetical protein
MDKVCCGHFQAPFVEVVFDGVKYIVEVLAIGTFTRMEPCRHGKRDGRAYRKVEVDVALGRYFGFPLGNGTRCHPMVPACEYVCRDDSYGALDPRTFLRPVALVPEVKRGPNARHVTVPPPIRNLADRQRFFCLAELL